MEKDIDLDLLAVKNPHLSLVHDNVRIRATPATEAAGVAGRIGNVAGFTTPSPTSVNVIGEVKDDLAFRVIFENSQVQLWFAPELLEFVDHAPGLEIQIGNTRLIRRADGGWINNSIKAIISRPPASGLRRVFGPAGIARWPRPLSLNC